MRIFWFALLLFLFLCGAAQAADLAIYVGYWGGQSKGADKIEFTLPNYYMKKKTGRNAPGLKFIADGTPLVPASDILSVKAEEITRLPMGGGLLKIKLSQSGKDSLERFFNAWTDNPDTSKNLLFVSEDEVKLVYEVEWVWLARDQLYLQVGSKSEAELIEQVFNQKS